jgi:hydroxylaminobenzene mutase
MANARMGLSAHLEGVMNGMFLLLLGLLWPRLRVGRGTRAAAYYAVLYGTFANIVAVLLAAFTGAGAMMPIAGGKKGAPTLEAVISALLVSLAIAMLYTCAVALLGLYRNLGSYGARNEE